MNAHNRNKRESPYKTIVYNSGFPDLGYGRPHFLEVVNHPKIKEHCLFWEIELPLNRTFCI